MHIGKRKDLYEKVYPETKKGGAPGRAGGGRKAKTAKLATFARDTATKTRVSRRSVERDATRAAGDRRPRRFWREAERGKDPARGPTDRSAPSNATPSAPIRSWCSLTLSAAPSTTEPSSTRWQSCWRRSSSARPSADRDFVSLLRFFIRAMSYGPATGIGARLGVLFLLGCCWGFFILLDHDPRARTSVSRSSMTR